MEENFEKFIDVQIAKIKIELHYLHQTSHYFHDHITSLVDILNYGRDEKIVFPITTSVDGLIPWYGVEKSNEQIKVLNDQISKFNPFEYGLYLDRNQVYAYLYESVARNPQPPDVEKRITFMGFLLQIDEFIRLFMEYTRVLKTQLNILRTKINNANNFLSVPTQIPDLPIFSANDVDELFT